MSDMPDATVTDLPKRNRRLGFVNKKNLGKAAALFSAGALTGVFLIRKSKAACPCDGKSDSVETASTDN